MDDKKVCSYCAKEFSLTQNLRRHLRNVHNVVQDNHTGKLHCPKCDLIVPTHKYLREHLTVFHGIEIKKEEKIFQSMEDFKTWKTFVEKSNSNSYIRLTSTKKVKTGSKTYYFCHRSGLYESRATGKKMIKIQGSNKVGCTCPASMEVIENEGHVYVVYWMTHVGHDHKRSRASLAENERAFIAKKLATGIPFGNAVDEMINGETEMNSEALHPIDNPDLHSMKRFISNCCNYHPDDIVSVEFLIQELELSNEMATIFYKPRGEEDENHLFEIDDFMIILLSSFQVKMVRKIYSETFCVDGALGKNKYDYQIVTVLTVDENAVGYPFATCITNRTDAKAMTHFFQKIKDTLNQELQCKVLLTADIPAIVNAWSKVMGEPYHHLLSSWHIIKNFQKHLRKIKNPELRAPVFQYVQVLIHEPDIECFEKLLQYFENDLKGNPSTCSYFGYFSRNFLKRVKQWALCYRVDLGIETNKHLEAFHEILKHIYLDGKKNHRLDNFVKSLLKLTRDKLFDRMTKLIKNRPSQIKHMHENHIKGRFIAKSNVTCVSEGSYKVASEQERNYSYIVTKENNEHSTCEFTCTACKICVHMYSCTCIDYLIKCSICKHIHACIISTWPDVVISESYNETFCEIDDTSDVLTLQLSGKDNSRMLPVINLAGEIIMSSNSITEITDNEYNNVIEHLEMAKNILKSAANGGQQIQSLVVPSVSEIPDSTGEVEVACKNLQMYDDHTYVILDENILC